MKRLALAAALLMALTACSTPADNKRVETASPPTTTTPASDPAIAVDAAQRATNEAAHADTVARLAAELETQRAAELEAQHVARHAAEKAAAGARRARLAARASAARPSRSSSTPRGARSSSTPAGGVWAALRACESGGNYGAVSASGRYRGAYQAAQGTWTAMGYSGDPAAASPDTQDQFARELQARYGWGQWPACARKLGLL